MTLKLLHLNIFQGKFLPQIIDYIKAHDFDILQFQEVSGGSMSKGGMWTGSREDMTTANPETVGIDCFETIKKTLDFEGVLNVTTAKRHEANSYIGNATFFKKTIKLVDTNVLFLRPYAEQGETPIPSKDLPRAALITTFLLNNKEIPFINCHLAWGPDHKDEPYKLEQAKKLYEYLQNLPASFILTGDFNVDRHSKIVSWLNTLAVNLVTQANITNTLNPNVHAAKILFPIGLGVDFAFVTKDLTVTDFHLVDSPDLSDHLGLSLTVEI